MSGAEPGSALDPGSGAEPRPLGPAPGDPTSGRDAHRQIRVAYVPLSSQPGGAERQMLALAERLPRDRFAPELILRSSDAVYAERARHSNIPIRVSGAPIEGIDDGAGGIRSRLRKMILLARTIRSAQYDVIDAWLYPMDVAVALSRPLTGWPVIISGRRNLGGHDRFGRIEPLVESTANRLTDTVVANSVAAAHHAIATQGVDPARLRIIRNGVDIPDPVSDEERAVRRHDLGVGPDDIVIGGVASYTPAKRLDLLIDAFDAVARTEPMVRLELIGEGPLRPALEAQVRKLGLERRVCLHGFVPNPECLYPALDIVVLSSDREGLPNALLEAGAAGRPILSTAAGGAVEIVTDGETGLLVPTGDLDALVRGLTRLVREPRLREKFAVAIRPSVERAFGMDRFVAEFAALYEERVEVRRHGRRRTEPGDA